MKGNPLAPYYCPRCKWRYAYPEPVEYHGKSYCFGCAHQLKKKARRAAQGKSKK